MCDFFPQWVGMFTSGRWWGESVERAPKSAISKFSLYSQFLHHQRDNCTNMVNLFGFLFSLPYTESLQLKHSSLSWPFYGLFDLAA